ncbi:MAG TPA: FG-GAP-like repeat-containing protein [Bacteroidota bacterium]
MRKFFNASTGPKGRENFTMVTSLIILLTSMATGQWNTQSPVPTHLDVRGVGAPTTQRVFIATDDNSFDNGGSLFESSDGGATWVQRDIPFSLSNPLNGLFFLDSQNGWVYGNDNYRTTDGGTTWTQLPLLGSTYFMEFYTTSFGLASGNFDRFVSLDGGDSWVASPNGMFAFDFADNLIGLGVADSALYRTTNGGTSFTPVHAGIAEAVTFLSSYIADAIVDSSFQLSTDGGVTWTTGGSADGRNKLLAVSANIVLAWGRLGSFPNYDDRILRSSDGGQTWADLGEVIPAGVFAFTVVDQQTVVASDLDGNMFRSADAGLTWAQTFISPGPRPGFLSSAAPAFANAQTGYFGYGQGFVIKTTDAGVNWLQISSGTGQSLNDIDRFANGNLIAVGDNGTLLMSDGLSPWIQHTAISQYNFNAVDVITGDEVVVVDEIGQVYRSTDAGATWTAASARPTSLSPAEDVQFTTPLDGWVIGQAFSTGVAYHTTDGGASWTPAPGFLGAYVAVDAEGTNVWAANVGGRYYRSTDAGATWIQEELPGSSLQIRDMDFYDMSTGYAVGWLGYAARSNDGGITWEVLPTPNSTDYFTDIHLLGANELWLSTSSDKAYYSATGGQNWAVMDIGSAGFGTFSAIAASPAGSAWTVGFQGYIEHFAGPPPPPLNRPPDASFSFIANGLTVDFTDASSDPDGFIVTWSWDFDDGSGSTEQHPSHTFSQANTYIVRLTVTDDDGDSTTTGRIVTVQPNPGGTFGDFTEVTPIDSVFVTPQDEDFWVITTAPADYDGDGDIDIAVLGYYVVYNQSVEDRLLLITNNGQTGFTYINVALGSLTSGASDLAWGDVDGDGDQDLAVGTDGETVIFRNDAGTLILTDTNLPGYWEDNGQADFDLRSITWADYDNDGDIDLLLPSVFDGSAFSYRTALMRNDGSNGTGGWIFTEVDSVFAPTSHAQSSWADYDGDQDLDLLLVNIAPLTDDGFIRRYRNDGNGVFVGEDILSSLTVEHGEAQWGDYDADGDLDVLIAGNIKETNGTYNNALRIYRNTSETYDSLEVIPCIPCEGWFDLNAATWADYDNDGDMDILLAGTYNSGSQIEGRAKVYTNIGGIFADSGNVLPAPRSSGDRGGTFSWFDIDSEGDLDYFIAGQYFVPGGNGLVEAQMHIYRNDASGQNGAPTAPSGLQAAVQDSGRVTLSWIPAIDDHTPGVALTYDLDLFRNGVPVAIPKHLPQPGNVSAVSEWLLAGLPDGHYDWMVRAVDAAYAGGPTATGEFTIGALSIGDPENNVPRFFVLEQNYPNPFNPSTTIEFALPQANFVTLKVYNIVGQEVRTLVSERMEEGTYLVQFNAEGLPSGAYVYRLHAGSFVQAKKLILMR